MFSCGRNTAINKGIQKELGNTRSDLKWHSRKSFGRKHAMFAAKIVYEPIIAVSTVEEIQAVVKLQHFTSWDGKVLVEAVEKQKLPTEKHPNPYQKATVDCFSGAFSWICEGELDVGASCIH
ncbi:hypothetical protein F0562_029757 [Nyssa sinensis]|uniref:Uncharacterized protein n=1 Tax=Nyssa sinensis TaxID=561372 RepID=A0A5J5B0K7_9ASTE|nr:hypothetical protein F0562_029757 [Nyssa sinensis]